MTKVTVAICTWNRSRLLHETLAKMTSLKVPDFVEWQLIVVNNNCTDDTDDVIRRYSGVLPIERRHEPEQGLSAARNRAMCDLRSELLIWTDDDVLVDENWLTEYVAAANRWPDAAFFCGIVQPWFEAVPPPGMADALEAVSEGFCGINLGANERRLSLEESAKGANMAFRVEKIRGLRFDVNLGLSADIQTRCEESAFCDLLVKRGEYGVWTPRAVLKHFVPASRLSLSYLRDFYVGLGQTYVRRGELSRGPTMYGVPRWLLRRYGEAFIRRGIAHCFGDEVTRYRAMADLWRLKGMIRECHAAGYCG